MRKHLALLLVCSILGINHVASQSNNNNLNLLATLAIGGVAGWAFNKHQERNRRQDAINDYLLQRSFGGRGFGGGFGGGFDGGFGGGFDGGFGGGFGGFGRGPWYRSRRSGIF